MNKKMNVHINFKTSILIMFLLAAYNIYAVSKDPYSGSRIFWDTDSELTLSYSFKTVVSWPQPSPEAEYRYVTVPTTEKPGPPLS